MGMLVMFFRPSRTIRIFKTIKSSESFRYLRSYWLSILDFPGATKSYSPIPLA
jgi:hypothetical protein